MTSGDREKLAREMRVMRYEGDPWRACADIAIASADRRVAEAYERAADEAHEFGQEIFNCYAPEAHQAVETVEARIRALSPARDGGSDA